LVGGIPNKIVLTVFPKKKFFGPPNIWAGYAAGGAAFEVIVASCFKR